MAITVILVTVLCPLLAPGPLVDPVFASLRVMALVPCISGVCTQTSSPVCPALLHRSAARSCHTQLPRLPARHRTSSALAICAETGMAEEPSAAVRELEEDAALPAGPLLNHLKLSAIHTLRSPRCPAARPRHHLARLRVVLFEGQLGKNRMEKCMSTAAGGSSSPAPASPEVHVAAWASTSAGGSSSPAPGFGEVGFGVHVEVVRISSSGWPTMACRRACHLPAPAHDSTSWFQHRTSSRSGGW